MKEPLKFIENLHSLQVGDYFISGNSQYKILEFLNKEIDNGEEIVLVDFVKVEYAGIVLAGHTLETPCYLFEYEGCWA